MKATQTAVALASILSLSACIVVVDKSPEDAVIHSWHDELKPARIPALHLGTGNSRSTVNAGIRIGNGERAGDIDSVNGSIRLDAHAQVDSAETVNGMIRVGRDVIVRGALKSVNGSISIQDGASVSGDLKSVNGGIRLAGARIGGDIVTVNSDLDTGRDSRIAGGIRYRKPGGLFSDVGPGTPRVVIGPGTVIDGALRFERPVTLHVHRSARIGDVIGAEPNYFEGDAP